MITAISTATAFSEAARRCVGLGSDGCQTVLTGPDQCADRGGKVLGHREASPGRWKRCRCSSAREGARLCLMEFLARARACQRVAGHVYGRARRVPSSGSLSPDVRVRTEAAWSGG
eukprot:365968-Chlamydomonas_euryale.AAC.10